MLTTLQKYYDLPGKEKVMFFEALLFLYMTKFILLFLSFKQMVKLISKKINHNNSIDDIKVGKIKKAIARANRLAFWKNQCLVKSLAARWMLRRREIPSQFYLGVTFNKNKKLIAHAWIAVNHFEIVNKMGDYRELTVFE